MPRATTAPIVPALLLAAGLAAVPPMGAQPVTVRLDSAASSVRFFLDATLHTVEGAAEIAGGELTFDPGDGSVRGKVEVDATSAGTGNERRDREMHAKVLESESWPDIVFVPEGFEGDLEGLASGREAELSVRGLFTLRGEAHPLVVPVTARLTDGRLQVAGSFVVPYVAWGLRDPSKLLLRVGKEVRVEVALEAAPASSSDGVGRPAPAAID